MRTVAVNLLPSRQRWYVRRYRFWRWLQMVSMGTAFTYVVLMGTLLSWRLMLAAQIKSVTGAVEQAKASIAALAEIESRQVTVKSKLARLDKLFNERVDFSAWLSQALELLPETVRLDDVKVESAEKIEMMVKTNDVVAAGLWLADMSDEQKAGRFLQNVVVQSMTKSPNGDYGLTLVLQPKKVAEK